MIEEVEVAWGRHGKIKWKKNLIKVIVNWESRSRKMIYECERSKKECTLNLLKSAPILFNIV